MFTYSLTFDYFIRSGSGPSSSLNPTPPTTTSKEVIVTLFPSWVKHIAVQWSIPSDWGHCLFNVYFSQTEDGTFKKVNVQPIDGSYLIDDETQEYRKFNEGFYIVEVLPQDSGSPVGVVRSAPITWITAQRDWVERRAREINRREYFLLTHFVGVKSYIFKRKTYGKRCPECWDYKNEKVTKDHCKTCLGTSFEGGYFAPVPCYFQYDADANQERRSYTGIEEPNSITGWTIMYPVAHPDDVVIRTGDWRAYRVDALNYTSLQAKTVRQMLKLTELNKEAIEYKLVTKNLPEYPLEYI